jgi:predicted amidohydrolase YtcJ
VKAYAAARPSQPWITGRGWGYALFPERVPHRRHLDAMLPDRPLVLSERDGHMSVCNTRALALAGITRDTPDPEHGRIVRDAQGEPTGELQESAMGLVGQLVPAASDDELYASFLELQDRAASFGLTSVCNASFSARALDLIERARAEGKLKLRFRYAIPFEKDASDADFARWSALEARFPQEWVSFGCAKGMLDGVVDARTAAMFEPFTNGENGIAMWEQGALDAAAERYDRAGYQLLFHAIGDRAVSIGLSAFEHVQRTVGPRDRRPRIEHAEVVRDTDLPRFVATGSIASTQALFATPDATTLENYSPLLGPERARIANAFSRFDAAGVRQAFGSDFPVFSMEVRTGLYVACARKTLAGVPADGYFPEFRITPEAALRHFTIDGAYANYWERDRGSLTTGKLADLVILSSDILSGPPELLLKTRVLATYVGGRPSYRAP